MAKTAPSDDRDPRRAPRGRLPLAAREGEPGRPGLPRGRERLYRRGDEAHGGLPAGALRGDARPDPGDGRERPLPPGRLLLLLAHRAGKAVPHLLPEEGQPGGRGGGDARPQPPRRGEGLHVPRGLPGERRRRPPRLRDRRHRLPAVHALRQGPARRRSPREGRGERGLRGLGGRRPHALLHRRGRVHQAAVPAVPSPRRRRPRTSSSTRRRTWRSTSASTARGACSTSSSASGA